MTEKEFLQLTAEEKANYINQQLRSGKTLKEIAGNWNRSTSWISKKMNEKGYYFLSGMGYIYMPFAPHKESSEANDELSELLKYKDSLIALAQQYEAQKGFKQIDFSVLNEFDSDEQVARNFKLPRSLDDKFESLSKKLGCKKQILFTYAIWYFLQNFR